MYRTQLINLLREFCLISNKHHSFQRLLNNTDYRNHSLSVAITENNSKKMSVLVDQIKTIGDLLNHQFDVELTNKVQLKSLKKQRFGQIALALSGLLFIATSVAIVEEIKHQRNNTHQTD